MRKVETNHLKVVGSSGDDKKVEEVDENIDLAIIISHNKLFVGRFRENPDEEKQDSLINAVEMLTIMDPKGGLLIIGNRFGDIFIPEEALVATMTKDSNYYDSYFKTTAGITAP